MRRRKKEREKCFLHRENKMWLNVSITLRDTQCTNLQQNLTCCYQYRCHNLPVLLRASEQDRWSAHFFFNSRRFPVTSVSAAQLHHLLHRLFTFAVLKHRLPSVVCNTTLFFRNHSGLFSYRLPSFPSLFLQKGDSFLAV